MSGIDVDRLPPTQYLILDVLAARYRVGEQWWTFPSSAGPALRSLEQAGLVVLTNGIVEHSVRARLTAAGKTAVVDSRYQAPNGGIDRLRTALEVIAEFAGPRADLVIGMDSIADTARRALDGATS
ncbi:hypothetical protein AMIS_21100 [Actinoplanes missouriensis 431]|uniref:Uncharacterized protein n=1 Tax=Actinoplanes missouriensis (strain ATCC 14538 / DSM 43046 / CBS 188.64 / JCM 3121 / NBRC 102363 / NCIMB 12654 / NRRL B-3342 / UNCC 431) TaxID=512565 RepID=I0H2U3_ACTM4|nr:hypothetical protein [Actinoplanes missouriensis]BAL87330.1 hypothetical protein AMIS_21100 [Actinoplanes missouriensis 431]